MELEILSIPTKKTYGLFSCPTQLLNYVSVIISQPLATLLNVSVERDEHAAPLFTDADILHQILLITNPSGSGCSKVWYAIHWINRYQEDKSYDNQWRYPVDSNLSSR